MVATGAELLLAASGSPDLSATGRLFTQEMMSGKEPIASIGGGAGAGAARADATNAARGTTTVSLALDAKPSPIKYFDEQTPATDAAYFAFILPTDAMLGHVHVDAATDTPQWSIGRPFKFGGFAFFDARFRVLSCDALRPSESGDEGSNSTIQISEAAMLEPSDLRELEDFAARGSRSWSPIVTFPFYSQRAVMSRKAGNIHGKHWAWLSPESLVSFAEPGGAFVVRDGNGRMAVHSVMLDVRLWSPRFVGDRALGTLPPPVVPSRVKIVSLLANASCVDDVDRFGLYSDDGELDLSCLTLLFAYGAAEVIKAVLERVSILVHERSNQPLSWWIQTCPVNRVVVASPLHPFSDAAIWVEDRGLSVAHWVALIGSETLLDAFLAIAGAGARSAAVSQRTAVLQRTPLHYAVYSGNVTLVKHITDLFGSSRSIDSHEATRTIARAAVGGSRAAGGSRDRQAEAAAAALTSAGLTALHIAVWFGNTAIARHLIDKGATPSVTASYPGFARCEVMAYDVALGKHAVRVQEDMVGWYLRHDEVIQPLLTADNKLGAVITDRLNLVAWRRIGINLTASLLVLLAFVLLWMVTVAPSWTANVELRAITALLANLAVPASDADLSERVARFVDDIAVGALTRRHGFMAAQGLFPFEASIFVGWACAGAAVCANAANIWNSTSMHGSIMFSAASPHLATPEIQQHVLVTRFQPAHGQVSTSPYSFETDAEYDLSSMSWAKLQFIDGDTASARATTTTTTTAPLHDNASLASFWAAWHANASSEISAGAAGAQSFVVVVGFALVHAQSMRVFPVVAVFERLQGGYQNAVVRTAPVPLGPYAAGTREHAARVIMTAVCVVALVVACGWLAQSTWVYVRRVKHLFGMRAVMPNFEGRLTQVAMAWAVSSLVPGGVALMFLVAVVMSGELHVNSARYATGHFAELVAARNFSLVPAQAQAVAAVLGNASSLSVLMSAAGLVSASSSIATNLNSEYVLPVDLLSLSQTLINIRRLCGAGAFFGIMGVLFSFTHLPRVGELLSFLRLFSSPMVQLACFAMILTGVALGAFFYLAYGIGFTGARSVRFAFMAGFLSLANGMPVEENTPTVDPGTMHMWVFFYVIYVFQILSISLWVVIGNQYESLDTKRFWWRDVQKEYLAQVLGVDEEQLERIMCADKLREGELQHRWDATDDRGRRSLE